MGKYNSNSSACPDLASLLGQELQNTMDLPKDLHNANENTRKAVYVKFLCVTKCNATQISQRKFPPIAVADSTVLW